MHWAKSTGLPPTSVGQCTQTNTFLIFLDEAATALPQSESASVFLDRSYGAVQLTLVEGEGQEGGNFRAKSNSRW